MVKKHALGKCNCKKTGKICNWEHNDECLIFHKVKKAYLSSDIEGDKLVEENTDFFETMYNCSQSITQSLKCCAGRDWENSFQETIEKAGFKENVNYAVQQTYGDSSKLINYDDLVPPDLDDLQEEIMKLL